jgi:D-3-phosphoglycerate dehydrogenase / 2-oxoglutarate reductase
MKVHRLCLIIDQMHPSIVPMLEKIGYTGHYHPDISRKQILNVLENYTGLIVRSKIHIDKEILEKGQKLKFIARAGAGLDLMDLEEIEKKNIKILNAPEANRDAVAEHTLGLLLNLTNKISLGDSQIKTGIWNRVINRGIEIKGKTISIIGYGNMGQAVAQRLSSFGCKVLAFDKYKSGFSDQFAIEANMEQIFEETDVLSLHIPLTPETRELINNSYLFKFKKPIFIINTARGEVLSLEALQTAIEEKRVLGAGLDVLENEKITSEFILKNAELRYLINSGKVIFTPHVAGWSVESYLKINEVLVSKILELKLS